MLPFNLSLLIMSCSLENMYHFLLLIPTASEQSWAGSFPLVVLSWVCELIVSRINSFWCHALQSYHEIHSSPSHFGMQALRGCGEALEWGESLSESFNFLHFFLSHKRKKLEMRWREKQRSYSWPGGRHAREEDGRWTPEGLGHMTSITGVEGWGPLWKCCLLQSLGVAATWLQGMQVRLLKYANSIQVEVCEWLFLAGV